MKIKLSELKRLIREELKRTTEGVHPGNLFADIQEMTPGDVCTLSSPDGTLCEVTLTGGMYYVSVDGVEVLGRVNAYQAVEYIMANCPDVDFQ